MSEHTAGSNALVGIGMILFCLFALTILFPLPWVILAAWLEERSKTKRILAEARLLEAQNAAKAAPHPEP